MNPTYIVLQRKSSRQSWSQEPIQTRLYRPCRHRPLNLPRHSLEWKTSRTSRVQVQHYWRCRVRCEMTSKNSTSLMTGGSTLMKPLFGIRARRMFLKASVRNLTGSDMIGWKFSWLVAKFTTRLKPCSIARSSFWYPQRLVMGRTFLFALLGSKCVVPGSCGNFHRPLEDRLMNSFSWLDMLRWDMAFILIFSFTSNDFLWTSFSFLFSSFNSTLLHSIICDDVCWVWKWTSPIEHVRKVKNGFAPRCELVASHDSAWGTKWDLRNNLLLWRLAWCRWHR